jgi:AGCS family alanine or glycine:cation symporter
MGIMEVFLDTIVICTLTALVILTSGISIPYGFEYGPQVTIRAFTEVCGNWVSIPLAICLCAFAVATIFGWGLYGLRCAQFIFGDTAWKCFACLQSVTVVFGAAVGTGAVWLLAELVNGLMSIPNLIALMGLSPELRRLTVQYKSEIKEGNPTA